MSTDHVNVSLTTGELRALRSWLDYGGVVGELQESELYSARAKLRDADVEDEERSIVKTLCDDLSEVPLFERRPGHWPRKISDEPQVGS